MTARQLAAEIVKQFEGFRSAPYLCPAGVATIGYGTTKGVTLKSKPVTEAEANALLVRDLAGAEAAIKRGVKVALTDNQAAALMSFIYNVGSGAFASSTLLKKLNRGDTAGAADEFPRWNKSQGRVLKGLIKRREAERALFLKD